MIVRCVLQLLLSYLSSLIYAFHQMKAIVVNNSSGFQASIRRSASYLIGHLFENSKLYLDDEAPSMISTLIVLLSDSDHDTVVVVFANALLMCLKFSI